MICLVLIFATILKLSLTNLKLLSVFLFLTSKEYGELLRICDNVCDTSPSHLDLGSIAEQITKTVEEVEKDVDGLDVKATERDSGNRAIEQPHLFIGKGGRRAPRWLDDFDRT